MKLKIIVVLFVFLCALGLIVYNTQAQSKKGGAVLTGIVTDASKQPVSNAAVYLIPASDIEAMAKTKIEIKRDAANDEPLEDNLAANRAKYTKAVTDKKGNFKIANIADGRYFVYVEPASKNYLPGGDKSHKSMDATELRGKSIKILVSGNTPESAAYVGSSKCLMCHKAYESEKQTLHKLGIRTPGKDSRLQDSSKFPDFDKGLRMLEAGKKFYFHNFDKGRGFDKYMISDKPPADPASVSFTATFFKDTDGKLKFKTENAKDPTDPARTYTVEMTYGGGLYKQRYLYMAGRNFFPFLQYNTMGDDSLGDRTRKQWRDYHGDWLYNEEAKKLTDPPKGKSFEKECASCHYTGYTLSKTASDEYIAGAVNDPNGEYDIDGDGIPNELNIGCEVCHGPGSEHVKAPIEKRAVTIVSPGKLSSERTDIICGQCHSRPLGYLKNEQPVNAENKMMPPGTSRNDFLKNYTTREDAGEKDYWPDGIHSKSHHQQYTDFIKSKKYRNGRQLVTCADCHNPHGLTDFKHQLRASVADEKNTLCTTCHKDNTDIKAHTQAKIGIGEKGKINCVDCHATKTMQTGAGFGKGLSTKDGKNYWMNDITSHIFDVPRKDNAGVKGVEPGKAMPIPYTNKCGVCHKADGL
ncbi:MAG: ammonia-forming cytochrome c nitrite reductase subunit c552 [Nitrospirota bacterium]